MNRIGNQEKDLSHRENTADDEASTKGRNHADQG